VVQSALAQPGRNTAGPQWLAAVPWNRAGQRDRDRKLCALPSGLDGRGAVRYAGRWRVFSC
jgi:hypothetical protein